MEAAMEEKSAVPSLDAEAMNQLLAEPPSQSGSVSFTLSLNLYNQRGTFINWWVPADYSVGASDKIYLYDGITQIGSWAVKAKSGSIDTGVKWKDGLSARYSSYNYAGSNWLVLMNTV